MKISPPTLHFVAIVAFFCIILTIVTPTKRPQAPSDIATPASAIASPVTIASEGTAVATPAAPRRTELHGELLPGDSLTPSLARLPLDESIRRQIIANLAEHLDFRRLRPGNRYTLVLDAHKQLLRCTYESSPLDVVALTRTDDGFHAEKLPVSLEVRTVRLSGTITTSLFAAFADSHIDSSLVYAFADIFASRLDFNTESRAGDSFGLVFEKYYKNGKFIGYGHLLMARYQRRDGGALEGFWYETKNENGSFYDRDGNDLSSAFIRSPVPVGRVTSKFTFHRVHPILGVVRPHLGVDLAAPVGTPIMAAGDGKVTFIGSKGGFGKQIILAHANGYRTYYGHLSRFTKGLRVGSHINQKEVIGYVGATGMATGPHLDYRLSQEGTFMNPFDLKFRPKSRITKKEMVAFKAETSSLVAELKNDSGKRVLSVREMVVGPDQRLALL